MRIVPLDRIDGPRRDEVPVLHIKDVRDVEAESVFSEPNPLRFGKRAHSNARKPMYDVKIRVELLEKA